MNLELSAEERFKLRQWLDNEDSAIVRKILDAVEAAWRERAATEPTDTRFVQGVYYGVRSVTLTLQSAAKPIEEHRDVPASTTTLPRRHATGGYV